MRVFKNTTYYGSRWSQLRDFGPQIFHAKVTCPLFDHRWQLKMHDRVCVRCRTSEPR